MRRILRHIYSRKTVFFYEYPLERPTGLEDKSGKYEYVRLSDKYYPQFEELLSLQKKEESVFVPTFTLNDATDRIGSGEFCFLCIDNNEVVGYCWFASKQKYLHEINATINLDDHWIYSYNAYVTKKYRGQNIVNYLFSEACKYLSIHGYTNSISFRMNWNISVQKAMIKLGFSLIGSFSVGYFLTFRYMINRCGKITIVNHSNPFDFYRKLIRKVSGAT